MTLCWQQTCLPTISFGALQSNLYRDHCSTSWRLPGKRSIDSRSRTKSRHMQCMPLLWPLRINTFEARYSSTLLPLPVPFSNFTPVGGWAQTTPQVCRWVCHSSGRDQAGDRHFSRHPTADLHSSPNWSWLLLSVHISWLLSSQPLCPNGGTQWLWYHQCMQRPLP